MSDTLITAFLTMVATAIATAAGFGWWLSNRFAEVRADLQKEVTALRSKILTREGEVRQDFQRAMSETRHTLYGRFDQQNLIQKDKDEDQDRAIHTIEVQLARAGINGKMDNPRKPIRGD